MRTYLAVCGWIGFSGWCRGPGFEVSGEFPAVVGRDVGNGGDASARVSLVCGRVLVFMFSTDGAREGDRTDVGATRVARADGVDHARGFGLCSSGLGHA